MKKAVEKQIDQEEFVRRKKIVEDAINFSNYIPAELRARLEAHLASPAARKAVLDLQLLAIRYGRAIERKEAGLDSDIIDPEDVKKTELSKSLEIIGAEKKELKGLLVVPANVKLR